MELPQNDPLVCVLVRGQNASTPHGDRPSKAAPWRQRLQTLGLLKPAKARVRIALASDLDLQLRPISSLSRGLCNECMSPCLRGVHLCLQVLYLVHSLANSVYVLLRGRHKHSIWVTGPPAPQKLSTTMPGWPDSLSGNALICLGPRAIGPLKAHLEPTPCPTQKLVEFPRAGVCLLELGRKKGARAFRLSLFQVTRTCTTEARASLCSCHLQPTGSRSRARAGPLQLITLPGLLSK